MIQLTDNNFLMTTKENRDKQSYLEFKKINNGFFKSFNSDYKILIIFLYIVQNIFIFSIILMTFFNEIETKIKSDANEPLFDFINR
jgi:hypothetical protein